MANVSLAHARDHLTALVRDVEQGHPVTLTRRGKPVAVLLSQTEFEHLRGIKPSFRDALCSFLNEAAPPQDTLEATEFPPPRDGTKGRPLPPSLR